MTNAAANIIPAEWKSISLEAMNEKAAMQTRVDRKYIVDAETAAKVLSTLGADASVMEIDGQRDFAYDSVYFDTPQMQSYHSAAYSRDDTFKIRTRSYLDSELTFLEVKTDGEQDMTSRSVSRTPSRTAIRLPWKVVSTSPQHSAIFSPAPCTSWRRF